LPEKDDVSKINTLKPTTTVEKIQVMSAKGMDMEKNGFPTSK